jgi:hypothetical protein
VRQQLTRSDRLAALFELPLALGHSRRPLLERTRLLRLCLLCLRQLRALRLELGRERFQLGRTRRQGLLPLAELAGRVAEPLLLGRLPAPALGDRFLSARQVLLIRGDCALALGQLGLALLLLLPLLP